MELEDYLDKVIDQSSLLEFAKALQTDKENEDLKQKENPVSPYSSGHNGWESNTISGYLEASIAWAEDSNFGDAQASATNTWKKLALFLYGGKVYE